MKRLTPLGQVELAMIEVLAKKNRLTPEQYLKKLIKDQYDRHK